MDLEQFLEITPRYFHALMERLRAKEERAQEMTEIMGAQIVAMVRQCGFVQFKEPAAAREFMPSEWRKKREQPVRRRGRNRQVVADEYRAVMTAVTKGAKLC